MLFAVALLALFSPLGGTPGAQDDPQPTVQSGDAEGSAGRGQSSVPSPAETVSPETRLHEQLPLAVLDSVPLLPPSDVRDLTAGVLPPGVEPLPLPEPATDAPLASALYVYARSTGMELPPEGVLDQALAGLRLTPEGERALARLVLSYTQAVEMRRDALGALSDQDRALLSLDPVAVNAWLSDAPGRSMEDLDAEARRIMRDTGIMVPTLQAADLLARAADAARGPLAETAPEPVATGPLPLPPRMDGPIRVLESILLAAQDAPRPDALPLGDAVAALYARYGLAPDVAPVPDLPPTLADAVARIVSAKAVATDPFAESLLVLEAAHETNGVLQAWGAVLQAAAVLERPIVLPEALLNSEPIAPVHEALALLDPAQRDAMLRGWEALDLLPAATWGEEDAALVLAWATAQRALGPGFAKTLGAAGDGLSTGVPASSPSPPEIPWPAVPASSGSMLHDDSAVLASLYAQCNARQGGCSGPAAILRVGGTGPNTYDDVAVIQIDLGGDDRYLAELAGPAAFTAGGTTTILGGHAIDVGGDDRYETPELDLTQGATIAGASVLVDLGGDDTYRARNQAQGHATGGVGILWDAAGDDEYIVGASGHGSGVSKGLGALVDSAGDDSYGFPEQARLSNTDGVGVFVDGGGVDGYATSTPLESIEISWANPGSAILNQGRFDGSTSGLALFLEVGRDRDTYTALDPDGEVADISDVKNEQNIVPNGGSSTAAGVFLEGLDTVALDRFLDDPDGDGTLTGIEDLYGTDPQDPSSHAGNLVWSALHPDAGRLQDDPVGATGIDDEGPWLRAPTFPPTNGFQLPGLVLGGRADDTYAQWVPFLVDLGGNDHYTAQNIGGVLPMINGVSPSNQQGPMPPTDVVLLLDVGTDGADTYAPQPCRFEASGASTFLPRPDHGTIVAPGPGGASTYVVPAACPSLGGALNGVAVLADSGGQNAFSSTLYLNVTSRTTLGPQFLASADGYGVTQGAGLFGGVGMLLTWEAHNEFESVVRVQAKELGRVPGNPAARAYGVAQGAAVNGVGILASFGMGVDQYSSLVEGVARDATGIDRGTSEGISQGAALAGTGILLDEGGNNLFASPQGFSQGFAGGATGEQPPLPGARVTVGSNPGPYGRPETATGLLWSGPGADTYLGSAYSQGAALGNREFLAQFKQGNLYYTTGDAGAFGVLVDSSGNDRYVVATPGAGLPRDALCPWPVAEPGCALSQGAGALHGVGLLVDLDGDDVYDASGLNRVQGAGVMGVGVLLDQAGQDHYLADSFAQGYAEHDGVVLADGQRSATQQLAQYNLPQVNLYDETATVGILADARGRDVYEAREGSQGAASVHLHELLDPVTCAMIGIIGSESVLVGQCRDQDPQKVCAGTRPGTAIWASVPRSEACDSSLAPGRQVACIAYCPGAVLGLLADAEGTDVYDYPGPKQDAAGGDIPETGNNWTWTQPPLGDSDRFLLAAGLGSDEAASGAVAQLLRTMQDRVLDASGVQVMPALDPVTVLDDQGSPLPEDVPARGDVALRTTVRLTPGAPSSVVDRVTFLVDGRVIGHGTYQGADDGGHVYDAPWATRSPEDRAMEQRFPDGAYEVVAVATLKHPPTDGRGDAAPSTTAVESPGSFVQVDNPPVVDVALADEIIRGDQGTLLSIVVGPDLASGPTQAPPGGTVDVQMRRTGDDDWMPVVEEQRPAGEFVVPLGQCGSSSCGDGRYDVIVTVSDASQAESTRQASLVIDGTPPTSRITTPPVAGAAYRIGADGLRVEWEHRDAPAGADAGDVAGVGSVRVLRLTPSNQLEDDLGVFAPGERMVPVPDVRTGQVLRFVTVATDRIGNSESPCTGQEGPPCFAARVSDGAVQEVLVDFESPAISQLGASSDFIRPGAPVRFTVKADEGQGSGIEVGVIRFSSGFSAPLVPLGDDLYGYSEWGLHNLDDPADERPFTYRVQFTDRGGNQASRADTAVLDGIAPRVHPLDSAYPSPPGGAVRSAASRGMLVAVRADIADAAVEDVRVDVSPIHPGAAPVDCIADAAAPGQWRCEVSVPAEARDGDYRLPWVATDVAGNVNATETSLLRVRSETPRILAMTVEGDGHDSALVRWTTDVETVGLVRYGRTTEVTSSSSPGTVFTTEHEARVEGLLPSTNYFFQVVASSRSGITNSSEVHRAETDSAYVLSTPGLPNVPLRGDATITVGVLLLRGDEPVNIQISLQDAQGRASPQPVDQLEAGEGTVDVTFDSRRFADGSYQLLVDGIRSGDVHHHRSSLVRIDNTPPILSPLEPRPDGRTAEAKPVLRFIALDPLSQDPVPLDPLEVRIDGVLTVHGAPTVTPAAHGGQEVHVPLLDGLPDGTHGVEVRLVDGAGNAEKIAWNFTVDARGPELDAVLSYGGFQAASADGLVDLHVNATDPSGVASVWVLGEGGREEPLVRQADGSWVGALRLPDLPTGTHEVRVLARDELGNTVVKAVTVTVDADAPRVLVASVESVNHTSLTIRIDASEPVTATASASGRQQTSPGLASTQTLRLEGLAPGTEHVVSLFLVDRAGNSALHQIAGTTLRDDEPPGAAHVRAESRTEGVVTIEWSPATDNAGIDAYVVERRLDRAWEEVAQLTGNATSFTDHAPVGSMVGYRITAVDVAGARTPSATVDVLVHALPRLLDASVSPLTGPSGKPFTFTVQYRHPGGLMPDVIEARYGALHVPLRLVDGDDGCRDGCTYVGTSRLPPTGVTGAPSLSFWVRVGETGVEVPLDESPRVTASDSGLGAVGDAGQDAPSLPLAAVLAVLASALYLRRRTPQ